MSRSSPCTPRAALVASALVAGSIVATSIAGCYASHERGDTGGEGSWAWSDEVTIFDPDGTRPVLQGWEHDVVAVDRGFVVLWIFNLGQLGIAMARFDRDAEILVGPTVLLPAMPPLDDSPRVVAGLAMPDGTIAVHWVTEGGELAWLRASPDGEVLEGPLALRSDLSIRLLSLDPLIAIGGAPHFGYFRDDDARAFSRIGPDGRADGAPFVPFRRPDNASFALVDHDDRAQIVFAERVPGGEDSIFHTSVRWDGSDAREPMLRYRGDNAVVTRPFVVEDTLWVEISTFERSWLERLDATAPPIELASGPNRGTRWQVLGDRALGVTEESDELFELGDSLILRVVEPRSGRVVETSPARETTCAPIEGYDTALLEGPSPALAVTWVDHCSGVRRLRARVWRTVP